MKNYIYPLIATSLITVTPFLITFEKGQDIVRGLFCYSILGLLLLFVNIRDSHFFLKKVILIYTSILIYAISLIDLYNLLVEKGMNIGWRWLLPLATCTIALILLKPVRKLSLYSINVILFISLAVHMFFAHIFPEQPIFEFPIIKAIHHLGPNPTLRDSIPEQIKVRYNKTDSVSITKNYVDSGRNNVIILVESWGTPMDTNTFNKLLSLFQNTIETYGIHFRMYSRTRTAEREDLLDTICRDTNGRRDSLFIPKWFLDKGYRTTFLFGGDSSIQWRYKYIRNIGFQNVFFADSIVDDELMVAKIDSILSNADSTKQFVAWTTRDTQFPMGDDAKEVEHLYFERLMNTLKIIAKLAQKHPETRFIVQGDHEPILSPMDFRKKIYRRWVPFVILN